MPYQESIESFFHVHAFDLLIGSMVAGCIGCVALAYNYIYEEENNGGSGGSIEKVIALPCA